jgi:hypothetical protein
MSRNVMSSAARRRAQKREVKKEILRLMKLARAGLAELDGPAMGAESDVVLEGRIVDGEIITDYPRRPDRR